MIVLGLDTGEVLIDGMDLIIEEEETQAAPAPAISSSGVGSRMQTTTIEEIEGRKAARDRETHRREWASGVANMVVDRMAEARNSQARAERWKEWQEAVIRESVQKVMRDRIEAELQRVLKGKEGVS